MKFYSLLPLYFPHNRGFSVDQETLYFPREIKYFIQLCYISHVWLGIKTSSKYAHLNAQKLFSFWQGGQRPTKTEISPKSDIINLGGHF